MAENNDPVPVAALNAVALGAPNAGAPAAPNVAADAAANAALEEMFANRSANLPFKEWFMQQLDNPEREPPQDLTDLSFNMIDDNDKTFLREVRRDDRISSKTRKSERQKDALKAIFLAICRVPNLTSLSLINFKTVITSEIGNLINLTDLTISRSNITEIPDDIGNLVNLRGLTLSENALTRVPSTIENLTNLTLLNLSKNALTEIPDDIGNLTNLLGLNLSQNALTRLPDTITNIRSLTSINLSRNSITALPDSFGELINLEKISIANNALTTLPASFGNLTGLRLLRINDNEIDSLPPSGGLTILDNLNQLEEFSMGNNPINETNPEISERILGNIEVRREEEVAAAWARAAATTRDAPEAAPAGPGLAFQVHRAFDKINKVALFAFLGDGTPIPTFDTNEEFIEYIDSTLRELIDTLPDTNDRKEPTNTKYAEIYDKIISKVEYTTAYKEIITNALEYIKRQPLLFKQNYIYYFVYDNFHAYNGAGSTLSCAKGTIERFIFALKTAAELMQTENQNAYNANNYEELISLVSPKTLQELINEYAQQCIQEERVTSKATKDERKAELKLCIRERVIASSGENAITPAINTSIDDIVEGLNSLLGNNNNNAEPAAAAAPPANNAQGGRRKQTKARGKAKTSKAKTSKAKTRGKAKTKRRSYRFRKTQKKHRK
jgi:Leucine-rich repeat (LRR) protein